ncbi:hypothetical protein H8B02_35775 [Bradyrhizobium sp. Pear77]|uniref:hypothetical protein n=1 Tax=Bradyrhizobium TaxID=374 RepID=UPI001E634238|nr:MULTISPECIES: hypothetical protein [Bradyrhizobium]MCC8958591.1 hypothetical protein [Bradyrhizobium altum]MCC8967522.1 hypothetical protein [Bradyrhizobium oropedii]
MSIRILCCIKTTPFAAAKHFVSDKALNTPTVIAEAFSSTGVAIWLNCGVGPIGNKRTAKVKAWHPLGIYTPFIGAIRERLRSL